jgi:hypothetical protein
MLIGYGFRSFAADLSRDLAPAALLHQISAPLKKIEAAAIGLGDCVANS